MKSRKTKSDPYFSPEIINGGLNEAFKHNFAVKPKVTSDDKDLRIAQLEKELTQVKKNLRGVTESFLLKLSDALRPLVNPQDIEEVATKIAMDFMDADRCYYNNLEDGNAIVLRDAWRGDLHSLAGVYPINSFPLFKAVIDRGLPFIVNDVNISEIVEEGLRQVCVQVQVISFINVPVIKNGKPVGILSLVQSKPRNWTDAEVQLTIETAERIWAAVERAKAEEALRKSEEKYRTLFASIDQGFVFCELVRNKEGKGIDYFMLEVNPTYEKQTGLSKEMVLGKTILQVFPTMDMGHIDTFAAVVDSQSPVVFEQYFEVNHRWHEVKVYPGEKDRFTVLFKDITQQKQAEEKIKESENRFRTMADASPALIWTIGDDGLSSYYNKTLLDFIGVAEDGDISDWKEIVHPDDIQSTLDTVNTATTERSTYSLECRLLRADGQWRWMLAQGNPQMDANNKILGFIGSTVDITERKQVEEKIAESQYRFHELIYSSPSMMAILTGENMIIEIANDAIITSWGKGTDVIGKSIFSVLPEIIEQGFDKLLLSVYKTGKPFHAYETPVRLVRNSISELIYYNFVYQAQRNINGVIEGVAIIANEVTSQALLNKRIRASEEKFKLLVLQAPVAICVVRGKDYLIETMNEGMREFWDKSFEQALNKPAFAVLPELRDQGIKELLDNVYNTGKRCVVQELSINLLRNGKLENVFLKFIYEPLREADGSISGVMALAHEITEQVLARRKIEESEKNFRQLAELTPDKISNADADGNAVYFNKKWLEYTGLSFDQLKDRAWHRTVHPDDLENYKTAWQQAHTTGGDVETELRLLNKNGEYKWHLSRTSTLRDENGKITRWIIANTEIQKLKEDEQRKSEFLKMVSHELKTPVTSIKGYVQFLSKMLSQEHEKLFHSLPLRSSLQRIESQVGRLARLVNEMLDLTRVEDNKLELHKEFFNLNDLVAEAVQDILFSISTHQITISDNQRFFVMGDKDRIGQVIINFITNAIKYSPTRDTIEVLIEEAGDNGVRVSVKDYGIGIMQADQQKIFQRFYRVEGENEQRFGGFGIGLFIAGEIIKRHSGFIAVKSEPGKGSIFSFTLPCEKE